jgi:hypothetical protein
MKRLWPHARRLGLPGALAAALTLAAALGAAWLPHRQQQLDVERQRLAERRAALRPAGPAADPLQALPPDAERQARTAALLALAAEQGLPWPRSEFRYQADRELGLGQYRVAMQLAGRYEALRAYVAEALKRDPGLALETLRLRRDDARPGELRAELGWVLHMRLAP